MQDRTRFSEEELTLLRAAKSAARTMRWKRLASISLAVPTTIAMVVPPLAWQLVGLWPPPVDRGLTGNLLREFATKLRPDAHLIVMRFNRLMFSEPIEFQSGAKIYPKGIAKFSASEVRDEQRGSQSLCPSTSRLRLLWTRRLFSQTPT